MKQYFAPLLGDGSNGSFCNTILEMGVDATVSKSLFLCVAVVDEGVVCKSAVVCVIVVDSDVEICCQLLERMFGFDCLVAAAVVHHVHVAEAGEMVHEDGGCLVSLFCQ